MESIEAKEIVPVPYTVPENVAEIALCGGPYNNYMAVQAFLDETNDIVHRFCLGDIGGFGPAPDISIEKIRSAGIVCIQGNCDEAVATADQGCNCGYLDPMDRKFAQISFDYTLANTSVENRQWLGSLPPQMIVTWGGKKILLCHGSPEQVNEFVWESETKDEQIERWLDACDVDGICVTHTGIPWIRMVSKGRFWFNVGVLGRPAHEGKRHVCYGIITKSTDGTLNPKLIPLEYDCGPIVRSMNALGLPREFGEALTDGIWASCYKILPPTELRVRERVPLSNMRRKKGA
jgi:predicted phosphodiesterase